jgi:hypothetical protein
MIGVMETGVMMMIEEQSSYIELERIPLTDLIIE